MSIPKVSVIIPVYNVENYIRECLLSVINQTLREIEIIVINDGCIDNSIHKISDLILNNNIMLVNQENKGLSAARNEGLKRANGEYIMFIDSDDYIERDFIEKLYTSACKYNLDIAIGGYKKLLESGELIPQNRHEELINLGVIDGPSFLYKSVINQDYRMEVWDDLYKKSFILDNNLFFLEGITHEDEEFTPKCFLKAKRIKIINNLGYIYRQRQGSIMSEKGNSKQINSFSCVIDSLIDYYTYQATNVEKLPLSRLLKRLIFIYEGKIENSLLNKEDLLKDLSRKKIRKIINYQNGLGIKLNIRYFILEKMPNTFIHLKKFKRK